MYTAHFPLGPAGLCKDASSGLNPSLCPPLSPPLAAGGPVYVYSPTHEGLLLSLRCKRSSGFRETPYESLAASNFSYSVSKFLFIFLAVPPTLPSPTLKMCGKSHNFSPFKTRIQWYLDHLQYRAVQFLNFIISRRETPCSLSSHSPIPSLPPAPANH